MESRSFCHRRPETGFGNFDRDNKLDMFRYEYGGAYYPNIATYFSTGEAFPDLLTGVTDSLGVQTSIEYSTSADYDNTFIPYIFATVDQITVDDRNGNQAVTTFDYQGAVYDPPSREFWGFATTTQTNPNGTILTSTFHQSNFLKGRKTTETLVSPEEGPTLTEATFTWDTYQVDENWAFVKQIQKETLFHDGVTVFKKEVNTYDDSNGYLLSQELSGSVGDPVVE